MSHKITITNKSSHPQPFEIHGYNSNHTLTVPAHNSTSFPAPDHTSGAIIALHQNHEGEQAEITKDGYGGNDFIDLSNIVGAGGNLTVEQEGEPSTLKGDAVFMQDLNRAWHSASAATKSKIGKAIHCDGKGEVVRMDAIKDTPGLEEFVRGFADGKTYIGVGSWNGSAGNKRDNEQSSAGKGDRDILVTYNDGSAMP